MIFTGARFNHSCSTSFSCQDLSMTAPTIIRKAARILSKGEQAQAHRYHHGNLRASLLEAAEAVLTERGVHGLTLRDVARAAGVSHGAPYHHFASLNELLAAVAERGFAILGDAMAEAVSVPDTRERLMRVAQAYVDCSRAHPERFRLNVWFNAGQERRLSRAEERGPARLRFRADSSPCPRQQTGDQFGPRRMELGARTEPSLDRRCFRGLADREAEPRHACSSALRTHAGLNYGRAAEDSLPESGRSPMTACGRHRA